MHHISEVHIRNFKSIRDHKFPLSKYTPLVGYNNAGKTNVLKALLWLLKRTSLSAADFNDQSQPVVVEVEVSGVDENILSGVGDTHRGRISPYIVDGKFRIRRQQSSPAQSTTDIRLEIWDPRLAGKDGNQWAFNPAGIDQAITALFPEPIHIGAMENATEDVSKFGTSTTIGKLLKEIMDPVIQRHEDSVSLALEGLGGKLSANSLDKDPSLMALDQQIGAEINTLFPGVTVKTHVPLPEFSDLVKAATIRIFEGRSDPKEGRDASSFGHGAQRSIQMALIKSLAERRRATSDATNRTTLLLIDEPELYLHPQAIAILPLNLVPICHFCNDKKRAKYPSCAGQQTFHPYFDGHLLQDCWVCATLDPGPPPALVFDTAPPASWPKTDQDRVRRHFDACGLAITFASNANNELPIIRDRLHRIAKHGGAVDVQQSLDEESDVYSARPNSWQYATYRALAANAWFVDGGYRSIP